MSITSIFNDVFEPALLKEMAEKGTIVNVAEGDTILNIGQIVRSIPVLLSGSLKISRIDEDGKELLLYYINARESCALTFTCCMQQVPSEVKATAEENSELLVIPVEYLSRWMSEFPSWKNFVMLTIQNRFHELLRTIDQIAFQNLDQRLVTYLREKSRQTGSTLLNLSHEEIATDLATSRVVISRLLKKLEIDNRLLLYRNQIKLLKEL